jgi:parallel beta-helix repeat protein
MINIRVNLIFIFYFVLFSLHATSYYVALNGNDNNPGTEALPWRHIQKAANTLIAGDSVFIKAGRYRERVTVQNIGTVNNYIVFTKYQNDEVIIDGTNANGTNIVWWNWNGLFDVSNKKYIKIIGLKIENSTFGGIWAEDADHITIQDNYTHNTFSCGIGVWNSNNIIVDNNEVVLACNDGGEECISIANSYNCDIKRNHVHNNGSGLIGGEGIDIKAGSHDVQVHENLVHHLNNRTGIYADGWDTIYHTYNIDIYQNEVHHCKETGISVASEGGGLIEYINIYNNLSRDNKYGGIEVGGWKHPGYTGPTPIKHIKIINNTSYNNGSYDNGWGFGININNAFAEDVIIRNNICSQNSSQMAIELILSGDVVDHNLIDGDNSAANTVFGTNAIIGNPMFIDAISNNFHLQNSSPAINSGNMLNAPNDDFDSFVRQGIVDIGAFEYNSLLTNQDNLISEKDIKLCPNPFSDMLTIDFNGEKDRYNTIKLFDMSGRLVRNISIENNNTDIVIINKNDLTSGIYVLNLQKNNRVLLVKKVIVL